MVTEAQRKATARYQAKNTKQYVIRLNKKTEKDLIRKLDGVPNKAGYLKSLIRKDIEKAKSKDGEER